MVSRAGWRHSAESASPPLGTRVTAQFGKITGWWSTSAAALGVLVETSTPVRSPVRARVMERRMTPPMSRLLVTLWLHGVPIGGSLRSRVALVSPRDRAAGPWEKRWGGRQESHLTWQERTKNRPRCWGISTGDGSGGIPG